jgi:hypothetical protein
MLLRSLVLMSEALNLHMITTTSGAEPDIERVRRVIHHVVSCALAPDGTPIA